MSENSEKLIKTLEIPLIKIRLKRNGWKEKGIFLYNKDFPFAICLLPKYLTDKGYWVEVNIFTNINKDHTYHLEKFILYLNTLELIPIYGESNIIGYFNKEEISEINTCIYRCYVSLSYVIKLLLNIQDEEYNLPCVTKKL